MKEVSAALVKACAEIGGAIKDRLNPAYKSMYADLSAVIEAVKGPLADNGLCFNQDIRHVDGKDYVLTVIRHSSGESLELAPFPIVATKPDAQGHGSALTYARRYSLSTALGVPAEDDDGNAASKQRKYKGANEASLPELSAEDAQLCSRRAKELVDLHIAKNEEEAHKVFSKLNNDQKQVVWHELKGFSQVRTWMKKIGEKNDLHPAQ